MGYFNSRVSRSYLKSSQHIIQKKATPEARLELFKKLLTDYKFLSLQNDNDKSAYFSLKEGLKDKLKIYDNANDPKISKESRKLARYTRGVLFLSSARRFEFIQFRLKHNIQKLAQLIKEDLNLKNETSFIEYDENILLTDQKARNCFEKSDLKKTVSNIKEIAQKDLDDIVLNEKIKAEFHNQEELKKKTLLNDFEQLSEALQMVNPSEKLNFSKFNKNECKIFSDFYIYTKFKKAQRNGELYFVEDKYTLMVKDSLYTIECPNFKIDFLNFKVSPSTNVNSNEFVKIEQIKNKTFYDPSNVISKKQFNIIHIPQIQEHIIKAVNGLLKQKIKHEPICRSVKDHYFFAYPLSKNCVRYFSLNMQVTRHVNGKIEVILWSPKSNYLTHKSIGHSSYMKIGDYKYRFDCIRNNKETLNTLVLTSMSDFCHVSKNSISYRMYLPKDLDKYYIGKKKLIADYKHTKFGKLKKVYTIENYGPTLSSLAQQKLINLDDLKFVFNSIMEKISSDNPIYDIKPDNICYMKKAQKCTPIDTFETTYTPIFLNQKILDEISRNLKVNSIMAIYENKTYSKFMQYGNLIMSIWHIIDSHLYTNQDFDFKIKFMADIFGDHVKPGQPNYNFDFERAFGLCKVSNFKPMTNSF